MSLNNGNTGRFKSQEVFDWVLMQYETHKVWHEDGPTRFIATLVNSDIDPCQAQVEYGTWLDKNHQLERAIWESADISHDGAQERNGFAGEWRTEDTTGREIWSAFQGKEDAFLCRCIGHMLDVIDPEHRVTAYYINGSKPGPDAPHWTDQANGQGFPGLRHDFTASLQHIIELYEALQPLAEQMNEDEQFQELLREVYGEAKELSNLVWDPDEDETFNPDPELEPPMSVDSWHRIQDLREWDDDYDESVEEVSVRLERTVFVNSRPVVVSEDEVGGRSVQRALDTIFLAALAGDLGYAGRWLWEHKAEYAPHVQAWLWGRYREANPKREPIVEQPPPAVVPQPNQEPTWEVPQRFRMVRSAIAEETVWQGHFFESRELITRKGETYFIEPHTEYTPAYLERQELVSCFPDHDLWEANAAAD